MPLILNVMYMKLINNMRKSTIAFLMIPALFITATLTIYLTDNHRFLMLKYYEETNNYTGAGYQLTKLVKSKKLAKFEIFCVYAPSKPEVLLQTLVQKDIEIYRSRHFDEPIIATKGFDTPYFITLYVHYADKNKAESTLNKIVKSRYPPIYAIDQP